MALTFCLPRVRGRGAGLGNELIPWARSFLCAQVLGATSLPPAFGANRRPYRRHFGTSRFDWLAHRALESVLPVVEFTDADHQRHGAGDVLKTFRAFAEEKALFGRKALVVVTEGMWGGYGHVAAARDFVFSTLYQSRYAARNLIRIRGQLQAGLPVVGMHVRMGDFKPAVDPSAYRGRFNISLPLQWYVAIAADIRRQLGDRVQFLIASDGSAKQLAPLTQGLNCVVTTGIPDADCSDLLALAGTDLLVCSASSFSAWATFLSTAPYLWYLPQLHAHPEGFHSIWGHESLQQQPASPTRRAIAAWQAEPSLPARTFAVGDDGLVPHIVIERMLAHCRESNPASDLVQYGVIPQGPSPVCQKP